MYLSCFIVMYVLYCITINPAISHDLRANIATRYTLHHTLCFRRVCVYCVLTVCVTCHHLFFFQLNIYINM